MQRSDNTMMGTSSTTASGLNTRRSLRGARVGAAGMGRLGAWDAAQGYSRLTRGYDGCSMRRTALFLCCFGVLARRWPGTRARPRPPPTSSCSRSRVRSTVRCSATSTTACRPPRPTARSWCCSSTPRAPSIRTGWRSAQRVVGPGRAGHRLGGSHDRADERERRRPAADVRVVAERASSPGSQTGPAAPDRPRPPRSGVPGPRRDDPGVAGRCAARTRARSTGTSPCTAPGRASTSGSPRRWRSRSPSFLNVVDGADGADGRRAGHAADTHRHHRAGGRARARSTFGSTTSGRSSVWLTGWRRRR